MASFGRIDLSKVQFTPDLLRCIPATTGRKYRVLPVFDGPETLCIVLADPSKLEVVDELYVILGRELQIEQADQQQLDTFIQRFYGEDER